MVQVNFTAQDWERVERDTMAWWAGELDRPLVQLNSYDPVSLSKFYRFLSNYSFDIAAKGVVDLYEPLFAAQHYHGDAFPHWWINFGPGIMAGFVGAKVNSVSDPSETVWFTPAQESRLHIGFPQLKDRGCNVEFEYVADRYDILLLD